MRRLSDDLEQGWRATPGQVARVLRDVGGELARLHAAGGVHGGVSPARVGITQRGGVALLPPDPSGQDPWWDPAPEVEDGDPPTPASDTYDLAATVLRLVGNDDGPLDLPEPLVIGLERALRVRPEARPDLVAFVVSATDGLAVDAFDPGPNPPPQEARPEKDRQETSSQASDSPPRGVGVEDTQGIEVPGFVEPGTPRAITHGPVGELTEDVMASHEVAARRVSEQESMTELMGALRSAADGTGTTPPGRRRTVALLAGGSMLVLLVGMLWIKPTIGPQETGPTAGVASDQEGGQSDPPSGASGEADPSTGSADTDRQPSGSGPASADGAPAHAATLTAPTAQELATLLTERARAWAAGDRGALAEVVVVGSPAWEEDLALIPPDDAGAAVAYEVSSLVPEAAARSGPSAQGMTVRAHIRRTGAAPASGEVLVDLALKDDGWSLVNWTF